MTMPLMFLAGGFAIGFATGLLPRPWWAIAVPPILIVLAFVAAARVGLFSQETEFTPVVAAVLFAFWPFVGAIAGGLVGRLARSRAR